MQCRGSLGPGNRETTVLREAAAGLVMAGAALGGRGSAWLQDSWNGRWGSGPRNISLWNSTETLPWACMLLRTCAAASFLRVYCHLSPRMLAAAFLSCQQQAPLFQNPIILFLAQHTYLFIHPVYLLTITISLGFFNLSHWTGNTEQFWKTAGILTVLWLWSPWVLFKYKTCEPVPAGGLP